MTLQELAKEVRAQFTLDTRTDGTDYWHRTDEADDWVSDLCMKAHGDMFPDDWKYSMIVDALDIIKEYDEDEYSERIDGDISCYNNVRLQWLSSSLYRAGYIDEAIEEFGQPDPFDFWHLLAMGEYKEREEVLYSVLSSLNDRLEEIEDDTDEDDEE